MNDPKERLIKLIKIGETTCCDVCEERGSTKCISCEYGNNIRRVSRAELIAEYLIANNVTVPPVCVGQTVYLIRKPTGRPAWVDECKVVYVTVDCLRDRKAVTFGGHNFAASEQNIGKSLFFTRKEAERALEQGSESE